MTSCRVAGLVLGFLAVSTSLAAQDVVYGLGEWDRDSLGNHRAVVRVTGAADAVRVRIPWRRRDAGPERVLIVVRDEQTEARLANVVPGVGSRGRRVTWRSTRRPALASTSATSSRTG